MRDSLIDDFLLEKKEEKASMISVKCRSVKYSDYKITTMPQIKEPLIKQNPNVIENVEIVEGVPPINDASGVTVTKDIFFEVMRLARRVDVSTGFNKDNSQAIQSTEILTLCRKYGVAKPDNIFNPVWTQYKIPGFLLHEFKQRVYKLYCLFVLYMAYYYEDYKLIRKLLPLNNVPLKNANNDQLLNAVKNLLPRRAGVIMLTLSPTEEGFALESTVSDIIGACYIYFALMIASNGGKNIRVCANPDCGALFIGRPNKKYCPNCDRRTVWSRKKRASKNQA